MLSKLRTLRKAGSTTKFVRTAVVIATVGSVAAGGTYSAFSSSTTNTANSMASGTVALSDNDSAAALYSVTNQKPGQSVQKCIKVSYTGTLDSDVKLYTASSVGALGPYVDLLVETGSGSPPFPTCTGFVADSSPTLFSGTLSNFASTHGSYANGLMDSGPGANPKWITNDFVVYRFTLTLQSDAPNSTQGATTGSHDFIWEARNQ